MKLEEDITTEILFSYNYPEAMGDYDIKQISDIFDEKNVAFRSIVDNMKYIPIQPPYQTLKSMVDEIILYVADEFKVESIYYKNISEYNFTESRMKKPKYRYEAQKEIQKDIVGIPNVLSMTILYHNNPLMWPLIFHEYAHTIFKRFKQKNTFQDMYSKIRVRSESLDNKIDQKKLNSIISEIFSDIFAINSYREIYFYAFCFHEIYSKNMMQLLNLSEDGRFHLQSHPPSSTRMKFMIEEISKRGFDRDNAFQTLIETQKTFADELHKKENESVDEEILGLFREIYVEVSGLFDSELILSQRIEIDYDLINELHRKLKYRYPIGTSWDRKIDLKNELKSEGIFNIETDNNIISMVYAGWKFLLLDILDGFYTEKMYEHYLPECRLRDHEKKERNIENKVLKFLKEFQYLISNIKYSMETSMIVSHFLEGKK